jgi:beta-glucosidase
VAERFGEYAAAVHGALGDRVRYWTTLNEPWCAAFLGYASGVRAPGRREPAAAVRAAHHLLLGHGLAAQAVRAGGGDCQLGTTVNLYPVAAASDDEADLDAARRVDGLQNRLFLDPLLLGRYPEDVLADLAAVCDLGHVRDGDLTTIAAPLNLLGVNYYNRYLATGTGDLPPVDPSPWVGSEHVNFVPAGRPVTDIGWEIDGSGLGDVLRRVHRDYPHVPLYVTENGAAFNDVPRPDGAVRDRRRLGYLHDHLRAAHDAIQAGVDLRGYFAWSLLDNFEWAHGYSMRFGLVYVDYPTQRRIPKDSARWYAAVIRRNGLAGVPLGDGAG